MIQSDSLTPVVLTHNEEPNIGRTLEALAWAGRVVVVDSGSTDATPSIARSFPNVDWRERPFDTHGRQWRFAVQETGISTEWALALDADMILPPSFGQEFQQAMAEGRYAAAELTFTYRVMGRDLMGSLYPPDLRVFRPAAVEVIQDGHTQRFLCPGPLYRFQNRVVHDDRKPLDRWVQGQLRYSALESARLGSVPPGSVKTRLRKLGLMPILAGGMAYVRAGAFLRGSAALEYAYERMTYESLLAMRLLRDEARQP